MKILVSPRTIKMEIKEYGTNQELVCWNKDGNCCDRIEIIKEEW